MRQRVRAEGVLSLWLRRMLVEVRRGGAGTGVLRLTRVGDDAAIEFARHGSTGSRGMYARWRGEGWGNGGMLGE